ncbi:MAG: nitrate reductase cytochrome c-type subunit [Halobacteriovoraceae bacterium]|nr:nitrate reductase cytochrome c-type subunit [Halobacteriovoraceae bacterium]
MENGKRPYIYLIIIAIILFVGGWITKCYFVEHFVNVDHEPKNVSQNQFLGIDERLAQEAGPFISKEWGWDSYQLPKSNPRSMDEYLERRAYHGAPPVIPHKIKTTMEGGEVQYCLHCHKNGNFAPEFNAYAPVVPHPDYMNCRQCHVAKETSSRFSGIDWKRPEPKKLRNTSLPGAPPIIPHGLQLRENCASCHWGPSAMKDIRTGHPERVNCLQCHITVKTNTLWGRKSDKEGSNAL